MARVNTTSGYFAERLADIFPAETEIRICGLAIGIELEKENRADALMRACLQSGLVVTTQGTTVLLLPALTIDRAVAAVGLDILANCVKKMQ